MSSYSPDLRIELIDSGAQAGTWGTTTNNTFAYLLEAAIAGYQTVSVTSANQALTHINGASATAGDNQSVYAMLRFTTTTGAAFSVYAPPASKQYIVYNNSGYSMTIYNSTVIGNTTAAGSGITVADGNKILVWSDGTNFYEVQAQNLTGTLAIVNGGTGQTTANAALNALLPAQTSNANKYLQTNGTNSSWDAISLSTADITGTLAVTNGGTGQATALTQYGVIYGSTTTAMATTSAGTSTQVLHGNASGAPTWGAVSLSSPGDVSGTLTAPNGGTGQSSYAVGDLLYASTTTALSKLADVATGNALISGGVTTAPSWGKIGLTTHVDGTLAATNGGTGASTTSVGDILYGSASNTWTKLAGNTTTTRKYLVSVGSGSAATAPEWDQIDISTGDITGTLAITNGGTGATTQQAAINALAGAVTIRRFLRGDGTNVSMAAIEVADVPTLNQNTTGTAGGLNVGTVLSVASGGTSWSSYSTGDILYASAPGTLSKLAAGTAGYALLTNGPSLGPSWGQIALGSAVSGTLPIANGGTNTTATPTNGGIVYGTGTAQAYTSVGVPGQVLVSNGAGASPFWQNQASIAAGSATNATLATTATLATLATLATTATLATLATTATLATLATSATALTTASGSAPSYSARAWVNFNAFGVVAIRAAGNVTSITDNGVGTFTANFTTAMSDANYAVVGTVATDAVAISIVSVDGTNTALTTTTAAMVTATISGTATDRAYVGFVFFR